MLSYPSVPTMDGKKLLKDCAVISAICRTTNMYSLGSIRACLRPHQMDSGSSSTIPAFSLRIRHS